jgi:hypothetical protein
LRLNSVPPYLLKTTTSPMLTLISSDSSVTVAHGHYLCCLWTLLGRVGQHDA